MAAGKKIEVGRLSIIRISSIKLDVLDKNLNTVAASDEEEAVIVANQHKVHSFNKYPKSKTSSESSKIKLNLSFAVYDCNQVFDYKYSDIIQDKKGYFIYTTPILNTYTGEITHPPEAV